MATCTRPAATRTRRRLVGSRGRRWMMHSGHHSQILTEQWRGASTAGTTTASTCRTASSSGSVCHASWSSRSGRRSRTGGGCSGRLRRRLHDAVPRSDAARDRSSSGSRPTASQRRRPWWPGSGSRRSTARPLSENFARHLATFVRLPKSQRGGNRKWRFATKSEQCSGSRAHRSDSSSRSTEVGVTVPPDALASGWHPISACVLMIVRSS